MYTRGTKSRRVRPWAYWFHQWLSITNKYRDHFVYAPSQWPVPTLYCVGTRLELQCRYSVVHKPLGAHREFKQGLPDGSMTMPLYIYGQRRFHRTWDGAAWIGLDKRLLSYGVCKNLGTQIRARDGRANDYARDAVAYRSTGKDGSIEFDMVRIGPAVVELQRGSARI